MSKLSERVAVVTGASKGIGTAIAKAFAAEGARVVVNYASDKQGAEKAVQEIESKGGKAIAVQADVSKSEDVKRLFQEAKQAFGKVDVLVNNAGIYQFDALENITEDEFHRQFNTNVLGLLLSTQEAVKHFPEKGGSVINVGSVITSAPPPNAAIYAGTKGAVDTITEVLAKELAPKNIRVNSVNPGGVETEGARRLGIIGSEFADSIIAQTPLGRFGQPEDIAPVAVFLASEDSGWLTGETLLASGGFK